MRILALAAALAVTAAPALAAGPQPITGNWLTKDGKAEVKIAPCGQSLCGKIVKIIKPTPGRPQTDIKNPDAAKRSRPLVGINILSDFTKSDDDWRGKIYDPENGRTYRSMVKRNAGGLEVKGCWGIFCKTQQWTPVS